MCKELQVIPVNMVVDPKRIIGKMEGQGGGKAQGVADQKKYVCTSYVCPYFLALPLILCGDCKL
jgi:hypothetical protein